MLSILVATLMLMAVTFRMSDGEPMVYLVASVLFSVVAPVILTCAYATIVIKRKKYHRCYARGSALSTLDFVVYFLHIAMLQRCARKRTVREAKQKSTSNISSFSFDSNRCVARK